MSLKNQLKNKKLILFIIAFLIFFTRFYNLSWGLPFPFHPDERNMAVAVMKLKCEKFLDCLKPDFFAYGQLPLYFSYFLISFLKIVRGVYTEINFVEATLGLRIFSLFSSLLTVFYLYRLAKIFLKDDVDRLWFLFFLVFPPFLIQYSHFGTTESFLMFVFTALCYYSLELFEKEIRKNILFKHSFLLGLGISAKVSALSFAVVPFLAIFLKKGEKIQDKLASFFVIVSKSIFISFLFSPYNFLAFREFFHSLSYESAVATGRIKVFYTKQFEGSLPIIFQLLNILPYSLGVILTVFLLLSFFFLGNERKIFILKLSFLLYFLSQAFLYAKWTRFIAPVFPIGFLLGGLLLLRLRNKGIVFYPAIFLIVLQGLSFFMIYVREDVRFKASNWMLANVPYNSVILSETANVIDLPVIRKAEFYKPYLNYYSFNFYDLDENKSLQVQLKSILSEVEYIIVPSRRVFVNFTCEYPKEASFLEKFLHRVYLLGFKPGICEWRKENYPELNKYYEKLFNGELGFKLIAEFKNYPSFLFFVFPDEFAEETFSVFDHPVVRVYKK